MCYPKGVLSHHTMAYCSLETLFSSLSNNQQIVKTLFHLSSLGGCLYLHFSHTFFNIYCISPPVTYPPVFARGHLSSMHTTSFPASPSIPLLKQASFAVSFLTFLSSPVSFFSKLWQAVQILAVCCSPLIHRQTFLLHKYTRISEEMQSDIRWPQIHSSLWYIFFQNCKKK